MRCKNSLYLVVVATVGLSLWNSILYQPQLDSGIFLGESPTVNVPTDGANVPASIAAIRDFHPQSATPEDSPCNDMVARKLIQAALDGTLLCPESKAYVEAGLVFNSRLKVQPGMIIRPTHKGDILAALQIADIYKLSVTVKDGGHNPAGFALNQGGLVIDMKYMDKVWRDEGEENLIRAQGGSRWEQVHEVIRGMNRSIVGGGCPQVGVVGLALGGGIGWPSRSRGLVSDSMVQATIMFPNGTTSTINDENHPDLMWALRGAGGSNFGVVMEVLLKTHPVEQKYFAGSFCFQRRWLMFRHILELYQDVINGKIEMDDRLTVDLFMSRVPPKQKHSKQSDTVKLCWAAFFDGPIPDALNATKELRRRLADLVMDRDACTLASVSCKSQGEIALANRIAKEAVRSGQPWLQGHTFTSWSRSFGVDYMDIFWRNTMAEEYTNDMLEATVRFFRDVEVAYKDYGAKMIIQIAFEHLGGAMRKNGNSISAWKHGQANVMSSIQAYISEPYSFWERGTDHHDYVLGYLKNWTDSYYQAIAPSGQGAYGNYADPDLKDWEDQYYGEEIYDRLKKVKAKIAGTHIFRATQRIYLDEASQKVVLPKFDMGTSNRKTGPSFLDQITGLFGKKSSDQSIGSMQNVSNPFNHEEVLADQQEEMIDEPFAAKENPKSSPSSKLRINNLSSLNSSSVELNYRDSKSCPPELLRTMIPVLPSEIGEGEDTAAHVGYHLDFSSKGSQRKLLQNDLQAGKKTVLLTGGSGGLGWSATLHLAKLGMDVVYTSQSESGCHSSMTKMNTVGEALDLPGNVMCVPLALDDFSSVNTFVERLMSLSDDFRDSQAMFDVVVLNAGMFGKFGVAHEAGNVSDSLAINHLGHFLLMRQLLGDNIIDTASGRVVVVSSFAVELAKEGDIENLLEVPPIAHPDPDPNSAFLTSGAFLSYAAAKSINVLFARELAQRLKAMGSTIMVGVAIPPGTAETGLSGSFLTEKKFRDEVLGSNKLMSTSEGALPSVLLASQVVKDDMEWVPGGVRTVAGCREKRLSMVDSGDMQCHVWDESLKLAGLLASEMSVNETSSLSWFDSPCKSSQP